MAFKKFHNINQVSDIKTSNKSKVFKRNMLKNKDNKCFLFVCFKLNCVVAGLKPYPD